MGIERVDDAVKYRVFSVEWRDDEIAFPLTNEPPLLHEFFILRRMEGFEWIWIEKELTAKELKQNLSPGSFPMRSARASETERISF